jgi:hypothetical protein
LNLLDEFHINKSTEIFLPAPTLLNDKQNEINFKELYSFKTIKELYESHKALIMRI